MQREHRPDKPVRLITTDCEEFNAWSGIVGWDTDYKQLGRGGFYAWYEPCISPNLRIGSRYTNREIVVAGTPPKNCVPLFLPLNPGDKGCFQGRPLDKHNAAILCPGSESIYRSPDHCNIVTISIPENRLLETFTAHTGLDASAFNRISHAFSLSEPLIRQLVQNTAHIAHLCNTKQNDLAVHELEDHLINAMIMGMTQSLDVPVGERAPSNRIRYVRRAQDFIEANLKKPLGLDTLARETHVSVRSLRYAFHDVLGLSPLHYIKNRRLIATHRNLLLAATGHARVTQIASDYGFYHLGNFARDYRTFFGQTPSATLACATPVKAPAPQPLLPVANTS